MSQPVDSKKAKHEIRSGGVTFSMPKTAQTFSDWYDAIMDAAELVDRRYPVKGCPVLRPYGFFMHNRIMRYVERAYERRGIHQALFPTAIPESFLRREEDHIKGFGGECYWVERAGEDKLEERLALRPTSETAIYYMFARWVQSFRDLPLKVHQTVTVFRYETKNTRPLIRVREIPWNEAHTCHATREEAEAELRGYWEVIDGLFNAELCVYGQRLQRAPWDKFAGAEYTEVLDVVMPCGRVLQAASMHYLGQKFAKVFGIEYLDQKQQKHFAEMTCCGVSTRALVCPIALHGDQAGLVLPPAIAQYQVVCVPCGGKKEAEVYEPLEGVTQQLAQADIRCTVDKSQKSLGEKCYYWEMKGAPLRLEMGPRDLAAGECVIVPRDLGKDGKKSVKIENIAQTIKEELDAYSARLRERAKQFHTEHVKTCKTLEEVAAHVGQVGGFARMPISRMDETAKPLEERLREVCAGAEIRGFVPGEPCEGETCAVTGEPAHFWAYVARAY